jgi:hypothetical protein
MLESCSSRSTVFARAQSESHRTPRSSRDARSSSGCRSRTSDRSRQARTGTGEGGVTEAIVGPGSFRRREEVLRAAARLFFDRGYAATSTADIARALGLQRGSVYYYLSTKEDLLYELVRDRYASGTALLERLRNDPRDAPTKLRRLIEEHVAEIAENLVPSALALNESRSLSADRRRTIAAGRGGLSGWRRGAHCRRAERRHDPR